MCIFLPLSYPHPGIYTSVKGTKPKEVIEFWKNEWGGERRNEKRKLLDVLFC